MYQTLCAMYIVRAYNKLYLKSENIKHYNTSSNDLLIPCYYENETNKSVIY